MRLLSQVSVSQGSLTYNVERGKYGLFVVHVSGTTPAADTVALTRAQLGNLILNVNGSDKINVDLEILSLVNNIYGGVGTFSATGGNGTTVKGTFEADIFIQTGAPFDPSNILDVSDRDKVYFKLDFSALAAKADAGSISVHGKYKDGVQRYIYKMLSRSVVSGGAGVTTDFITEQNISSLYIKNPSLVDQIQLTRNGKVVVDDITSVLQAYSDWIHQLETTNVVIAVEFAETGRLNDTVSNSFAYKYQFNNSGTLAQYYASLEFTPLKAGSVK